MSPLEEQDYQKLIIFEKELEKKTDIKLDYFRDVIFSIEEKERENSGEIFKLSKQMTEQNVKIGNMESLLFDIKKKIDELEQTLNDPQNGIYATQYLQWGQFSSFIQKTEGELHMNQKEHDELVKKLDSLEKKIENNTKALEKIMIYFGVGFALLFASNTELLTKFIKLILSVL